MLLDHFLPARTFKSVQKDIPEKGNLSELSFTLKEKNIYGSGKAFNSSIQIKKKLSLKSNILNINQVKKSK